MSQLFFKIRFGLIRKKSIKTLQYFTSKIPENLFTLIKDF